MCGGIACRTPLPDRTVPVTPHSTGLCQEHSNTCEGMESFETAVNEGLPLKFRLYLDTQLLCLSKDRRGCATEGKLI